MGYRITESMLEARCIRINETLNRPRHPYPVGRKGALKANIGNFHISHAYGGVCLHEMVTDGGGVRDVFECGHVPKRDLFNRMSAMLRGIEVTQS